MSIDIIRLGQDMKWEIPSRANLLAAYSPHEGSPSMPAMLVIFTIVPVLRARKPGSAARIRRWGPKKLVSIWALASSSLYDKIHFSQNGNMMLLRSAYLRSSTAPSSEYPALLTNTSTWPYESSALLNTTWHAFPSVTSNSKIIPPFSSMADIWEAAFERLRTVPITRWLPSRALRAISVPSPDETPVINQTAAMMSDLSKKQCLSADWWPRQAA